MHIPFLSKNKQIADPTHYVEIRNLSKVYNTPNGKFIALDDLSVQIEQGKFVAFIGRSGSGKSTLINCLTGIDRPTSGELYIDGVAVQKLNEFQLARWRGQRVGLVFQFFQLLPTLSLAENVMLPMELMNSYPPNKRRKRAMELLDMVGLADHAHKLPADTSGGQQQRVAIARSLANDPAVIVCDEPTGNLDIGTAQKMFELFEEVRNQGKTVIMVTHDDDLAHRADHVFLIESGILINEYLSDVLDELTTEQINEVVQHAHITDYKPGTDIIQQGDMGDDFFVILDGAVDILVNHNNRQFMVGHQTKGGVFGEMALLENTQRSATVRTDLETGVKVASINRITFQHLMDESESFRNQMQSLLTNHRAETIRKLAGVETVTS